jgi:B12-binding domain/radical SAM domain protein
MFRNNALIFYYHRLNSYSFNTLAGAIDSDSELQNIPIGLALTEDHLRKLATDALKQRSHATIALSVLTCQFAETGQFLRQLRTDHGKRITILAGGPHVTARPEDVLSAGADIAFRGEAEANFLAVLHKIDQGLPCEPIQTSNKQADIDTFFSISPKRGMFGPIEITRGCAFACHFCQTSHIFGTHLRHRSIDNIVQQAEALRSINRKVVRLLSPNAFSYGSLDGRQLNLKAIHALLAALRTTISASGKIIFAHFPSEARPEHITPDTLGLLREFTDNDEIVIGAQSGSQRMLDACHRSHTVDDVLTAVSLARKHGYKVIVDFILGLPNESAKDMQDSLKVMEQLVRMGARVHPHIFAPLPQTAFAKEQPGNISPLVAQAVEEFRAQQKIYENAPKPAKSSKRNWGCSPLLKT